MEPLNIPVKALIGFLGVKFLFLCPLSSCFVQIDITDKWAFTMALKKEKSPCSTPFHADIASKLNRTGNPKIQGRGIADAESHSGRSQAGA